MTYSNMKDFFLILQDKYGSPYYTDAEIALFLNRAQLDEAVALLPIDGSDLNVELNANTIARIEPLLFKDTSLTMASGTGVVAKSSLDALLTTDVLRILAIAYNNYPVKSRRYNNWFTYLNNVFKAPSTTEPKVYETGTDWIFSPVDNTAVLTFMGVRYPREMSSAGTIDCELPDLFHNEIVARALALAGVGSRDQMLSELKKLNMI